jgi:hypothetical protein
MKKQVNLALPLGGTLALVVVVVVGLAGSADDKAKKPALKKLGTIDLLMVETTPVVFKDRLYRFEYVRDNYHANKTGASYFCFIDVATGKATPASPWASISAAPSWRATRFTPSAWTSGPGRPVEPFQGLRVPFPLPDLKAPPGPPGGRWRGVLTNTFRAQAQQYRGEAVEKVALTLSC